MLSKLTTMSKIPRIMSAIPTVRIVRLSNSSSNLDAVWMEGEHQEKLVGLFFSTITDCIFSAYRIAASCQVIRSQRHTGEPNGIISCLRERRILPTRPSQASRKTTRQLGQMGLGSSCASRDLIRVLSSNCFQAITTENAESSTKRS